MRKHYRPGLGGAVVTGLALTALALPASTATAVEPAPAAAPVSQLLLTIAPDSPSADNPHASVTLECEPTGGDHPTPEDACRKLLAVDGQIDQLTSELVFCPQYLDPVTITAMGNWGERPVLFSATYINRPCAEVDTDGVFRF